MSPDSSMPSDPLSPDQELPPLQSFQHQETAYERPTRKWVCGRDAEGLPCHLGPDAQGKCYGSFACHPRFENNRWLCVRPANRGGPCEHGPFPDGACAVKISACQPALNLRARRVRFTIGVTALGVGLLAVLLATPSLRRNVVDPGPLASPHATALEAAHAGDSQAACSVCHAGDPSSAVAPGSAAVEDSRCLKCHDLGPHAGNPHSLADDAWPQRDDDNSADQASQTTATWQVRLAAQLGLLEHQGTLGCAVCHQEHQGAEFQLADLHDSACQNCHRRRFGSFDSGHPEFHNYAYSRRTRIYFDHVSHYGTHFKGNVDCTRCHLPDTATGAMRPATYEASCRSCHERQITESRLAVVRLPKLDVETLNKNDLAIGEWPENANGKLTRFTRLLVPPGDVHQNDLTLLEAADSLRELSAAKRPTLEAAARIAWQLKQLLSDLQTKGPRQMSQRIGQHVASDKKLTADQKVALDSISRQLSADTVRAWQQHALPSLAAELQARADGQPMTPEGRRASSLPPARSSRAQGWHYNSTSYSLDYRATGHADPVFRAWYDLLCRDESAAWSTAIARRLNHAQAPGTCLRCHTIDRQPDGTLAVNWYADRPGTLLKRKFTRFAHRPHLPAWGGSLDATPGDAPKHAQAAARADASVCSNCHVLDFEQDRDSFARNFHAESGSCQVDSAQFVSNFAAIRRQNCTSCHTRASAGDRCLLCHNYHVSSDAAATGSDPAPPESAASVP